MIAIAEDRPFLALCRVKWNNINHRVRNRKSYRDKNIQNQFTFVQFVEFARDNNLEPGLHCHRPDRYSDYRPDNLQFITAQQHHAISGKERRVLTNDQIEEIEELSLHYSLRKIARRYGVSHVTIYRYLKINNERTTQI